MKFSENSEHMNKEARELHRSGSVDIRSKQMSTSSSSSTTIEKQNVSFYHHHLDLELAHDDKNNKTRANILNIKNNHNNSVSDIVFINLFAEHEVSTGTPSASMLPNEKRWYYTPVSSSLLPSITSHKDKKEEEELQERSLTEKDMYHSHRCHWQKGDELLVDCALYASLQCVMNANNNNNDNNNDVRNNNYNSKKARKESNWEWELETLSHLRKPSDAMYANVHTCRLHSSWVQEYISSAMSSFTFSRDEYEQLCSSSSVECHLSYSEASLLFVLYAQYGNFVVIADRWPYAWERLHDMHENDREQQESKEEEFKQSNHLIEREEMEHSTECPNTASREHKSTQATGQSYQNNSNNNNNKNNINGIVDSADETHHFMSVEALCQAHHVISQGILLNRMQRLEEAFRSTLSINDKNVDVCGIVKKDDDDDNDNIINKNKNKGRNVETNKRHKRGREFDENDKNLSSKVNENVPLLSLLRKHPILQNYTEASSEEHTTKPLPSESISRESSVQMQTESHNKSNDNRLNCVRNEIGDNNDDEYNLKEMNSGKDDKCILESVNNSREVSVNTELSTRQGHALRKRSRNNDNDRRRGARRATFKTPLASLTFSSSTTTTAAVNDQHVLRSLSKFNELVKSTTHWYCQESEMRRRGVLRELVTCESMSNVCFHRAVEQYIVTIQEARNVLQRAYPIFYDNTFHQHHHAIHSVNGSEPFITVENKGNVTGDEHSMQVDTLLHEPEMMFVHDCDIPIAPAALFDVTMKELHGCEASALLRFFGVYQEYEKQISQKMSNGNNVDRQLHEEHAEDTKADIYFLNEKRYESNKIGSSNESNSEKVDKMDVAISNNNFGSNINANEFSSTVQALVEEVEHAIPFRCTRLCKACQAGWLLPEPLPLHTLTSKANNNYSGDDDDDDDESYDRKDCKIDKRNTHKSSNTAETMSVIHESNNVTNSTNAVETGQNNKKQSKRGRKSINACKDKESSKAMRSTSAVCTTAAAETAKLNSLYDKGNNEAVTTESVLQSKTTYDALGKAHNVDDIELLSYVHKSGVCNRAFSHIGESVLLSLPRHVHKLHREVEEELEKYLFDSGYALMEDDGMAGELVQQIRRVYTQNLLLSRYVRRVQHIEENLHKVVGTDVRSSAEKLPEHHHHHNSREHVHKRTKRAL